MTAPTKTILEIMAEASITHMGIGAAWDFRSKASQDALISAMRAAVQAMPDVMEQHLPGRQPLTLQLSTVREAIVDEQKAHRPIGGDEEAP